MGSQISENQREREREKGKEITFCKTDSSTCCLQPASTDMHTQRERQNGLAITAKCQISEREPLKPYARTEREREKERENKRERTSGGSGVACGIGCSTGPIE